MRTFYLLITRVATRFTDVSVIRWIELRTVLYTVSMKSCREEIGDVRNPLRVHISN